MTNEEYKKVVEDGAKYIESKIKTHPKVALILGSGLGEFANLLEDKVEISYSEIAGLPVSTVKGHAGKFVFGKLNGKDVVCMQGRFHLYEGYLAKQVVLPIYIFKLLGIETLVVTNAAGGVNTSYSAGDLMIINDHVNLTGTNALIGGNILDFGEQFIDMSAAYDRKYIKILNKIADEHNIKVQNGTYLQVTGPTYETPAEIRAFRQLGADAVGMSTVQEVIVARQCKIRVAGVSCVTNMGAGVNPDAVLNHQEVVEVANRVKNGFTTLLVEFVKNV